MGEDCHRNDIKTQKVNDVEIKIQRENSDTLKDQNDNINVQKDRNVEIKIQRENDNSFEAHKDRTDDVKIQKDRNVEIKIQKEHDDKQKDEMNDIKIRKEHDNEQKDEKDVIKIQEDDNVEIKIQKEHSDIIKTKKYYNEKVDIQKEHIIKLDVTNNNIKKDITRIEESRLPNKFVEVEISKEKTVPKPTSETEEEVPISNETLLNVLQTKQGEGKDRDLWILNPDPEITSIIKKTFEAHGCSVDVGGLERDLVFLYVLLDRKVSIKRLRKLMEKGKKFGLEFFLTKTGLTSSLMARNLRM